MICVTELRRTTTRWASGLSCRLFSDDNREELMEFAGELGLTLPDLNSELGQVPCFHLGPLYRARALKLGARPLNAPGARRAIGRFRGRERVRMRLHVAGLP